MEARPIGAVTVGCEQPLRKRQWLSVLAARWLRNTTIVGYLAVLGGTLVFLVGAHEIEAFPTESWLPQSQAILALAVGFALAPAGAVLMALSLLLRLAACRFRFSIRDLILLLTAITIVLLPLSRAATWLNSYLIWTPVDSLPSFSVMLLNYMDSLHTLWMELNFKDTSLTQNVLGLVILAALPIMLSAALAAMRRTVARRFARPSLPV